MQSADHKKNNKTKKNNSIIWLTASLLAVLVIATVSVAGSCLYSYAHQSDCQISLYSGQETKSDGIIKNATSQKKAAVNPVLASQAKKYTGSKAKIQAKKGAFEVDDNKQVWKTKTAIELFKAEYKNADGKVTVKSADGSKVIAPGTEGNYTFSLKNTSNSTADYKIWIEAELSSNLAGLPLKTRMGSDKGWLLGGKDTWKKATALDGVATTETIAAGRNAEYTIYWKWPFEQGTDTKDTDLANTSANQEMSYTVTIYTLAVNKTGSDNPNSDKPKKQNPASNPIRRVLEAVKTGDDTQILPWLVALAAATGIVLCLLIVKKRKNDKENEQDESRQRS